MVRRLNPPLPWIWAWCRIHSVIKLFLNLILYPQTVCQDILLNIEFSCQEFWWQLSGNKIAIFWLWMNEWMNGLSTDDIKLHRFTGSLLKNLMQSCFKVLILLPFEKISNFLKVNNQNGIFFKNFFNIEQWVLYHYLPCKHYYGTFQSTGNMAIRELFLLNYLILKFLLKNWLISISR